MGKIQNFEEDILSISKYNIRDLTDSYIKNMVGISDEEIRLFWAASFPYVVEKITGKILPQILKRKRVSRLVRWRLRMHNSIILTDKKLYFYDKTNFRGLSTNTIRSITISLESDFVIQTETDTLSIPKVYFFPGISIGLSEAYKKEMIIALNNVIMKLK